MASPPPLSPPSPTALRIHELGTPKPTPTHPPTPPIHRNPTQTQTQPKPTHPPTEENLRLAAEHGLLLLSQNEALHAQLTTLQHLFSRRTEEGEAHIRSVLPAHSPTHPPTHLLLLLHPPIHRVQHLIRTACSSLSF